MLYYIPLKNAQTPLCQGKILLVSEINSLFFWKLSVNWPLPLTQHKKIEALAFWQPHTYCLKRNLFWGSSPSQAATTAASQSSQLGAAKEACRSCQPHLQNCKVPFSCGKVVHCSWRFINNSGFDILYEREGRVVGQEYVTAVKDNRDNDVTKVVEKIFNYSSLRQAEWRS